MTVDESLHIPSALDQKFSAHKYPIKVYSHNFQAKKSHNIATCPSQSVKQHNKSVHCSRLTQQVKGSKARTGQNHRQASAETKNTAGMYEVSEAKRVCGLCQSSPCLWATHQHSTENNVTKESWGAKLTEGLMKAWEKEASSERSGKCSQQNIPAKWHHRPEEYMLYVSRQVSPFESPGKDSWYWSQESITNCAWEPCWVTWER